MISADGSNRREIGKIDNRQGEPAWSPDGSAVYFTVQERGNVRLYRLPATGGQAEVVVTANGTVGGWSVSKGGSIAYAFTSPTDLAQLYIKDPGAAAKKMTDLNAQPLAGRQTAETEAFTFIAFRS